MKFKINNTDWTIEQVDEVVASINDLINEIVDKYSGVKDENK